MTHTTLPTILDNNNKLWACIGKVKGCPEEGYYKHGSGEACPKCLPCNTGESIKEIVNKIQEMPDVTSPPDPHDAV